MSNPSDHIRIPKGPPQDPAEDYVALRALGLGSIARLGNQYWTDYNEHDPGITMLEALAYAITDLGYRTNFSIEEVLAQLQESTEEQETRQFPQAREVLTSSPVNREDMRRSLGDLEGVANVWLDPVGGFEPVQGVYRIVVQKKEGEDLTDEELQSLVEDRFANVRNLGEDFSEVVVARPRKIALSLELDLEPGVQADRTLAAALVNLNNYLQGAIQFYSLHQMQGIVDQRNDQVFEGPALLHGFVPDASLPPKPNKISAQAFSPLIQRIPGVLTVNQVSLAPIPVPAKLRTSTQAAVGSTKPNTVGTLPNRKPLKFTQTLNLAPDEVPVLADLKYFDFDIQVGGIPQHIDLEELKHLMEELEMEQASPKQQAAERNLPIPQGKFRNLERYHSVQYELPAIYRLRPGALTEGSDPSVEASAHQLRGYLAIFDQVMANYLSQLAHLGDLFSWKKGMAKTYFFQGLEQALHQISDVLTATPNGLVPRKGEALPEELANGLRSYHQRLGEISETPAEFVGRRNQFLDHLTARFGWAIADFVGGLGRNLQAGETLIEGKAQFLREFPAITAARGKGGDYLEGNFEPERLSGLRRLIESLLGVVPESKQNHALNKRVVLNTNDPDHPGKQGDYELFNLDNSAIDLPFLLKIGQNPNNYKVITSKDRLFTYRILDEVLSDFPSQVFWTPQSWKSGEEARAAGADLAAFLREYNRTSERLHVMDHVLLRPGPEQNAFGLSFLDRFGKRWMETSIWYNQAELAQILELQKGNYQVSYGTPFLGGGGPPFTFVVSATQGGKPFPVYPPSGIQLPADIPKDSPVFLSNDSGTLFKAYLQAHFSTEFHHPARLGAALLLDFIEPALPADWQSAGKAKEMTVWGSLALKIMAKTLYPHAQGSDTDLGNAVLEGIGKWLTQVPPSPGAEALLLFHMVLPYLLDDHTKSFLAALRAWGNDPELVAHLDSVVYPALKTSFLDDAQLTTLQTKIKALTPDPKQPDQYRAQVLDLVFAAYVEAYPKVPSEVGTSLNAIFTQNNKAPGLSSGALAYLSGVGRNLGKGFLHQFFSQELKDPSRLGAAVLLDFNLGGYPSTLEPSLLKLAHDDLEKFAFHLLDADDQLTGKVLRQALLGKDPNGILKTPVASAALQSMGLNFLGAFLRGIFNQQTPEAAELGLYLVARKTAQPPTAKDLTTKATLTELSAEGLLIYAETQFASKWQDEFALGTAVLGTFLHPDPKQKTIPGGAELANVQQLVFAWYIRNVLLKTISPGKDSLKSLMGLSASGSPERFKTLVRQGTEFFYKEGYVPGPADPTALGKLVNASLIKATALPKQPVTLNAMAASGAFLLAETLEKVFPATSATSRITEAVTNLLAYFVQGTYSSTPGGSGGKDGKSGGDSGSGNPGGGVDPSGLSEFEQWFIALQTQAANASNGKNKGKDGKDNSKSNGEKPKAPGVPVTRWTPPLVTQSWLATGDSATIIKRTDQLNLSDFGWLGAQALAIYLALAYPALLTTPAKLVPAIVSDLVTPQKLSGMTQAKVKALATVGNYLMLQGVVYRFADVIDQEETLGAMVATWLSYTFPAPTSAPQKNSSKGQVKQAAVPGTPKASGGAKKPTGGKPKGAPKSDPVQYHVSLQYRGQHAGWVNFQGLRHFPDADTIEVLIEDLVGHIAEVRSGKMEQQEVFLQLIKPLASLKSAPKQAAPPPVAKLPTPWPDHDPYSFRVSVLLPDWPTRFQDKSFRVLLENTLVQHAPAHLGLQIYWLDKVEMQAYEGLVKTWQSADPHTYGGHTAANRLARWLNDLSPENHPSHG